MSESTREMGELSIEEVFVGDAFSSAVEAMKNGKKVTRKSWRDKNKAIFLTKSGNFFCFGMGVTPSPSGTKIDPIGDILNFEYSSIWFANGADVLAADWEIL